MKTFEQFILESKFIKDGVVKYIGNAIKLGLENNFGNECYKFDILYDSEIKEYSIEFNLKYLPNVISDEYSLPNVKKETILKIQTIEKIAGYFLNKYNKEEKNIHISNNNYSGMFVSVKLSPSEILEGHKNMSNEMKSFLTINKFNL